MLWSWIDSDEAVDDNQKFHQPVNSGDECGQDHGPFFMQIFERADSRPLGKSLDRLTAPPPQMAIR